MEAASAKGERAVLLGAVAINACGVPAVHEPPNAPPSFEEMADALPVMLWRINGSFDDDWANKAWYEFTGGSAEEERGFGWVEKIHPNDRERVVEEFDRAFDERQPVTSEFRLLGAGGDYRLVRDSARPVFRGELFLGFVGTCAELSADRARDRGGARGTSVGEAIDSAASMLAAASGAGGLAVKIEEDLTLAIAALPLVRLLGEIAASVGTAVPGTEPLPVHVARWGEFGVISITLPSGSEQVSGRGEPREELAALLSAHGGRLWVEQRGDSPGVLSIGLPLAS